MENETWDGTAEPVSREARFSDANGDREIFIFPVQLTSSRIGDLTCLIYTLLYVMTIHTYASIKTLFKEKIKVSIYFRTIFYRRFIVD